MRCAGLLALLFANSAFATGLDDLRGAFAALQGQGTLRGTYEVRQQTTELDGKDKTPDSASAVAQVEEDASGLQVRWDRALIKRANEQAWAVVANRLVLLKREEQGTAKGLGNTSQYRNTYTFTPRG